MQTLLIITQAVTPLPFQHLDKSGATYTQIQPFTKKAAGLKSSPKKRIQTEIKNLKLKVTAVNQGDTIRVTGKNIDDLQAVMRHLKV